MARTAKLRLADRIQRINLDEHGGVAKRSHTPVAALTAFFLALSLVVIAVVAFKYWHVLTGAYICLAAAFIVYVTGVHLEKLERMQQGSEALLAMFSSVLGAGYRFCFVAHESGEIVYMNRDFQEMFPRFVTGDELTLAAFCALQGFTREARTAGDLMAMTEGGRIPLELSCGAEEARESIVIEATAVHRPRSFVLVRGR